MRLRRRHCILLVSLIFLPVASSLRVLVGTVSLKKFSFRGGSTVKHNPYRKGASDAPNAPQKEKDHHDDPKESKKFVDIIISAKWARFLYLISALNPVLAVLYNDYGRMIEPFPSIEKQHVLAKTYGTLFFFAKLKPRVSFSIGAILRGLQLTTAFQYVFDPTSGVGFGLNLICLFAKSRWPATIVLGWSFSKAFWKILGACPPSGLPVPITISLKQPKDAPVATKGYRIGL